MKSNGCEECDSLREIEQDADSLCIECFMEAFCNATLSR
jgi:hypothetical protein